MSVDILFLGTGDAFGSGGRLPAAALLTAADIRVLVDCGPSTLAVLRSHGIDPETIDAVLLTHLHGDHFGGVPFLLMDAYYASKRTRPLVIAGPPGHEDQVAQAQEALFPGHGRLPVTFPLTWVPLQEGERAQLPQLGITALRVAHAAELACFGLRIECGGRVLAFSGDTEWTDTLVTLAHDADLFVCECVGYDAAPPGHIDYQSLLRHRPLLTCRAMLLTHMGGEMLHRLPTLEIPAASDGLRLTV